MCELAHATSKCKQTQFKAKHDSLIVRRGKKRAVIAVAHKLLEVGFTVIKNKQPYKDPNIDYQKLIVDKNASRWLKALSKYGYLQKQG